MKRILTLTDFSQVANHAIKAAMVLAKKHDADLDIYHVLKSSDHIMYELDEDPQLFIRNKNGKVLNTKLDGWRQMAIDMDIKAHFIIGAVDIIHGVLDITRTRNTDLIVMGSTGLDETDSVWGTTTQQVIKGVDVPVLVIKSEVKDFNLDDIVFASDLDFSDQEVLRRSLDLLQPVKDAVIHFVSINTSSFFSQPRGLMTSVLEEFEKLAKPYKSDSTFLTDYNVKSGIRHYLEDKNPDVLIMSNRDRNLLKKLFIPNAAIEMAGKIDCPVLILK